MKTPTTITVIAWNYCQNRCTYCVSGSNKDEWKLNGKSEVWKPEGDENLNYYELCDKYGFGFHERMCPEPDKYLDAKDVLDFDAMIAWVKKYRPDAHIHISGGEPLLRPDIEEQVAKVCAEFETTIVTNGQLISKRPKLLDLPVKWLLTWHNEQCTSEVFLKNADLIKDKPHLITLIVDEIPEGQKNNGMMELSKTYGGPFNIETKPNVKKRINKNFTYNPEDLNDIASRGIMLIQPNGPVVGCNKNHRGTWDRYKSASNIYTMTCDEDNLSINNDRAKGCVANNRCSAYQTAVKMSKIGVSK